MRAVFMGTPHYGIPVVQALLSLGYQVVGVYTQPDKPSGRGRFPVPPPTKTFALEQGIPVFQPTSLRQPEAQAELARLAPDVAVVAAYGKILPPEVLRIPRFGHVNVHPSLLPKYRGPSPVASAILHGETRTGTSIMLLDEGMDSGQVLAGRLESIQADDTTQSLTPRLFRIGAELLTEVLPLWVGGEVAPQPQDQALATVTKKLQKEDGDAQWELAAEDLERRLRAFTPWPGLFTSWNGRLLKILSATALPSVEGSQPGTVIPLREQDIPAGVVAGRGVLGLKTLQLEGKRPIACEEFLRGYGDFLGSSLVP